MKRILITGANGYLGSNLIKRICELNEFTIYAVGREKSVMDKLYHNLENIQNYDINDFHNNKIPFDKIDIIIHCAFARAHKGEEAIIKSIDFTNDLFNQVNVNRTQHLINISTQEVYNTSEKIRLSEKDRVAPSSVYGAAKYFTEVLTNNLRLNKCTISTNLRLAGLIGYETDARMVSKLVDNVVQGNNIKILGGDQVFSQLDIRDAVEAIICILNNTNSEWENVYNIGYKKSYNILEIVDTVLSVAHDKGYNRVKLDLEKKETDIYVDLDSSLFYRDFSWTPSHDMESTVKSIYEFKEMNLVSKVM